MKLVDIGMLRMVFLSIKTIYKDHPTVFRIMILRMIVDLCTAKLDNETLLSEVAEMWRNLRVSAVTEINLVEEKMKTKLPGHTFLKEETELIHDHKIPEEYTVVSREDWGKMIWYLWDNRELMPDIQKAGELDYLG